MGFRFEFDSVNKILLARFEGRLTDELAEEFYEAAPKYSTATDANASITDLAFVTEFAISAGLLREMADQKPAITDATRRPYFIVAPSTVAFGLMRMFQTVGQPTRPLLNVVRTMDEALTALGVQSPNFEPLE
jgi:hypothetical protein